MPDHRSKATELNARGIEVHFSPALKQAFRDLAAAVHFSEHFDDGMLRTVQEWAEGRQTSLHSVLIALPLIASETFRHGDVRAQEAWDEIGSQILEKGITLTKIRARGK